MLISSGLTPVTTGLVPVGTGKLATCHGQVTLKLVLIPYPSSRNMATVQPLRPPITLERSVPDCLFDSHLESLQP